MKGNNLVKKTIAFTAVAAMCSSFAVVAEADELNVGDSIQFSPAKMKITSVDGKTTYSPQQEDLELPEGITGVVTSDKSNENTYGVAIDSSKPNTWQRDKFQFHNKGAYGNGWYLNSSTQKTPWTVTITLNNVPAGMYDFDQYVPGGGLDASNHGNSNITVKSSVNGSETTVFNANHNFCNDTLDAFANITTNDIPLEGTVTITYDCPTGNNSENVANNPRLDVVKLTKTGEIPTQEVKTNATLKQNINDTNGDGYGASVWEAEVKLNNGTYTDISVQATDAENNVKTAEKISGTPVLTGESSVYLAIAVNKLSTELATENPVVVTVK